MESTRDRIAWLTTIRADGSPHTTPVWFVLTADPTFWIASASSNIKVGNIRRDPRVSIAVDGSGATPLVAEGRARIHDDLSNCTEATSLLRRKYGGWDAEDGSVDGVRVLIEIPVHRWLSAVPTTGWIAT
ncbi:TIGR03618 family F420-dependent PPOX class oxidoreductase [Tsukamurella pseudospumae]|nr:TIGR03618 family F420-dependent PPOX class oxidoreductase [Tsukamurella pseudospumae]